MIVMPCRLPHFVSPVWLCFIQVFYCGCFLGVLLPDQLGNPVVSSAEVDRQNLELGQQLPKLGRQSKKTYTQNICAIIKHPEGTDGTAMGLLVLENNNNNVNQTFCWLTIVKWVLTVVNNHIQRLREKPAGIGGGEKCLNMRIHFMTFSYFTALWTWWFGIKSVHMLCACWTVDSGETSHRLAAFIYMQNLSGWFCLLLNRSL